MGSLFFLRTWKLVRTRRDISNDYSACGSVSTQVPAEEIKEPIMWEFIKDLIILKIAKKFLGKD